MSTLAANALTKLSTVRDALRLDESAETSNLLRRLINAASDAIQNRAGRVFGKADLVELIAGFGTTRLVLARPPINTLTSIVFDSGSPIDLTDVVRDDAAGLLERGGGWSWTAHVENDISRTAIPGTERRRWTVTYNGGWVLPKDETVSSARALPFDIEEACIGLARHYFLAKDRDPGVVSEKQLSYSATYSQQGMPPPVAEVVDSYRRAV